MLVECLNWFSISVCLYFNFESYSLCLVNPFFCSHPQVMLAASYWSLLAPAIEMAEESGKYGAFAFLPVAVGFVLGAAFVYFADLMMPYLVSDLFVFFIWMDFFAHMRFSFNSILFFNDCITNKPPIHLQQ